MDKWIRREVGRDGILMEKMDISRLIRRIKEEPSVLFLGQNYLKSYNGHDAFCKVVETGYDNVELSSRAAYSRIWEAYGKNGEMDEEAWSKVTSVRNAVPTQLWLRRILSMKWGMIFSSAIDGVMQHCVGENFALDTVGYDKKTYSAEYMNKRALHGCFLYGTIDGNQNMYPPSNCDEKTLRGLRKRAKDRIGWIYNNALCDYGVFVIDGWNPDEDWADFLLDDASDMPYDSIYIFGVAQETVKRNKVLSGLIEDGIACAEEKSFTSVLRQSGYFEEDTEFEKEVNRQGNVRTVTLKDRKGNERYYDIPMSDLEALDGNITLVHDSLGKNSRNYDDLKGTFASFLNQNNVPAWPLYQERLGFYFNRNIDDLLEQAVVKEQEKKSYHGRLIFLEGVSNSGKTASLVHFALKLREEKEAPVFFISGNPTQKDYIEKLKGIIKWYFIDEPSCHERIPYIVIIWDNNHDANAVAQYENLTRELMECNPIIIGSCYGGSDNTKKTYIDRKGNQHIPIGAKLEDNEVENVRGVLARVDNNLLKYFDGYVERGEKCQCENVHLLESLLRMSQFMHSPEWREVSGTLVRKYQHEVSIVEDKAQKAADLYWSELVETEELILSHGVGAAWQIKLQLAIKEAGLEFKEEEKERKFGKELQVEEDIGLLNDILAMAGQFSVELPLGLLLRTIHGDGPAVPNEDFFINDVLKSDSLLDYNVDAQGYVKVQFRNPKEAELYLDKKYGSLSERKEQEVKLLLQIIQQCRWSEEGYDVLSLVRRFGSNSDGKYSEKKKRGHYFEYKEWWKEIASSLIDNADENPEAILVYAHFLRDISKNEKDRKLLHDAAGELHKALEAHDQGNQMQYCRLLVEVCANLVEEMEQCVEQDENNEEIYRKFRNIFKRAVSKWTPASTNFYFNQNSLLDIGLNALINYHAMLQKCDRKRTLENADFIEAMSETVHYIDILFDMESDFESVEFLSKIEEIYSWYDCSSIKTIGEQLERKGNDTYLFLEASRCWISTSSTKIKLNDFADLVRYNTFLLPDDADRYGELYGKLDKLRDNAISAAKKAIAVLEPKLDSIRRMQSGRCLYMLIKAKWLAYTGHLPLEEKQTPNLNLEQWQELYQLCEECIGYTKEEYPIKPTVYFIDAMYRWIFTPGVGDALSMFSNARQEMRRAGCVWFIERVGLCKPGTSELTEFNVDIQKNSSGNFEARLCKEFADDKADTIVELVGRRGIHVSDKMLKYLFDGQPPKESYNIQKKVSIWFTGQGASLGMPKEEKGGSHK